MNLNFSHSRLSGLLIIIFALSVSSCAAVSPARSERPLEDEDIIRNIHSHAATLTAGKTKFSLKSNTESRFFSITEEREGDYAYQYDQNQSLTSARGSSRSNDGSENFIWLSTCAFIQRNDSAWEPTNDNPDQSLSVLTAYNVFTKLENKFTLIRPKDPHEPVEYFYGSTNKSIMELLSQIGNINLQHLPLNGLKAEAHFYVVPQSGQIQQVNVQIIDTRKNSVPAEVQLIFYDINQPLNLVAPSNSVNAGRKGNDRSLDEAERWKRLSTVQAELMKHQTYKILSDVKYVYNTLNAGLHGHTVNSGQVVKLKSGYLFRGDRRVQNDRTDVLQEFVESPSGNFVLTSGNWVRQPVTAKASSPAYTLIYDLLQLNQGLSASENENKTIFSYSGKNRLFFMLCRDLFHMDLSELNGQNVQIDLSVTADKNSLTLESFSLRLRTVYNNVLDLTGYMQFLEYDSPRIVDLPPEIR